MSIQILITEVTSAEIVDESSFRVLKKKIINESMREIEKKKRNEKNEQNASNNCHISV